MALRPLLSAFHSTASSLPASLLPHVRNYRIEYLSAHLDDRGHAPRPPRTLLGRRPQTLFSALGAACGYESGWPEQPQSSCNVKIIIYTCPYYKPNPSKFKHGCNHSSTETPEAGAPSPRWHLGSRADRARAEVEPQLCASESTYEVSSEVLTLVPLLTR